MVPLALIGIAISELLAFAVIERVAVRAPFAAGVAVRRTWQVAPGAKGEVQSLIWVKSDAFVPVMLMLLKTAGLLPVFWRVTVCWAEVKVAVVSGKATAEGAAVKVAPWEAGERATAKVVGAWARMGWKGALGALKL